VIEDWEVRRAEELEDVLTDAFENSLDAAIESELEKLTSV
jgi:hypothetical protein